MSGQASRLLGRWGEALAADYLTKKGYTILAAGWRCRFGEIDLIAADKRYLCFVEVKLRTTAELYLAENPTALQPRFDVVEVEAPQGTDTRNPVVRHVENAF